MDISHILMTLLYWIFVVSLLVFFTGFAVTLSHAKQIQRWKKPIWGINATIAVFSLFPGLPVFWILNQMIEIPAGPWNIFIAIILGVIVKNYILEILQKYRNAELTTFSLKHFG